MMAGEKVGVQGIIKQVSPLAFYTHCAGHKINLVIAHSYGITGVSDRLGFYGPNLCCMGRGYNIL